MEACSDAQVEEYQIDMKGIVNIILANLINGVMSRSNPVANKHLLRVVPNCSRETIRQYFYCQDDSGETLCFAKNWQIYEVLALKFEDSN